MSIFAANLVICVFLTKHYLFSWFTAKDASVAARKDLTLLKELALHEDHMIKEVGTNAMNRHLWYLYEVTVGLALFDEGVTNNDKLKMVSNMNTVVGSPRPTPRLTNDAANNVSLKEHPDIYSSAMRNIFPVWELLVHFYHYHRRKGSSPNY